MNGSLCDSVWVYLYRGQDGVLRCFWGSGGVGGYGYGWLVWLPRGFALEYNYSECIQVRSGKFVAN